MGPLEPAIYVAWAFLMMSGCYAQLCHRLAHEPNFSRPKFAWTLQRYGLAISPKRHWAHHQHEAFGINFAIASGWSNIVLNVVFRFLPGRTFWLLVFLCVSATQIVLLAILLKWLATYA